MKRSEPIRIYIACGLTHVPRDKFQCHVQLIHRIAAELTSFGAEVRYALKDSDPLLAEQPLPERARLCYTWDRQMVEWADAVIGEASFPSIGLGIELQIATHKGTPIILCFKREPEYRAPEIQYENPDKSRYNLQIGDGFVTLMALGIPTIFRVLDYATEREAICKISAAVELLFEVFSRTD